MERFRVRIDEKFCIGAGVCAEMMPLVFSLNDQGVAEAPALVRAPRRRILDVAEGCPVRAISVIDADTEDQVYP